MSSFWGALAFAGVELPEPLTWGVIKGLQLRNIRYWARQPGAYNPDGTLTIGFNYPNLNITENYNSPGSPYWCCKSFITLSLPEDHPFWKAQEEPYPEVLRNAVKPLEKPLHITTNLGGHTYILSSGQQCSYPVKQSAAKYGKFAYSSAFGYSVPTGDLTLEEHSADSVLALSEDDGETWKERRVTKEARIEDGKWLRSMWHPWKGVEIETWLFPPQKETPLWHLRVHRIKTSRPLLSAEGGFAIYGQRQDGRHLDPSIGEAFGTLETETEARVTSRAGVSGIANLGNGKRPGKALRTDANSNLIVARAIVPTLMAEYFANEQSTWLVTAVFALPSVGDNEGAPAGWQQEWQNRPKVPEEIEQLIRSSNS